MDNAQRAIMVGVGLFITIIVIAAIMLITGLGRSLIDEGTNQVNQLSASLQQQLTQDYDGSTITGAAVRDAVKRYCNYDNMIIQVKATTDGTYKDYGKVRGDNGSTTLAKPLEYDSEHVRTKIGVIDNSSNATDYVPNTAKYSAELIRRPVNSDVVLGIVFTRLT